MSSRCRPMPGLAEVPPQRPEPELSIGVDHRDEVAQVVSAAGELQGRLPVPGDRAAAGLPHIPPVLQFRRTPSRSRSRATPWRARSIRARRSFISTISGSPKNNTRRRSRSTTAPPSAQRRVAPLVLLASPQRGGVPQREFRSADQRVEHAAAAPVRVIELPVLVLDDDEVGSVAHFSPISDDAVSVRASFRDECRSRGQTG